ncbi:MAG: PorT family protein [Sporocytophaga sp.]|uniref:porin family protein n=1 Tax=Sporocytophaga sp. TaxID=2231183 RepID=UPI001B14977D|nr:porin family protein [Sporocytophaga sp.]MBO9698595.1 PorT family protein [Sporocytophaga sp.]
MKALLKNRFTGIFLVAVCFLTFTNNIATAQDIHDPWKINIYFSPEYTSRFLSVTSDQSNVKELRKNENGTFGYSIGLNFEKHLNDRFAFGLGGRYSKKGYKKPLTTLSAPINGNDQTKGSFKAELLEFPVFVDYSYIKKEKLALFLRVGPSFNYLIEAKEKTDYYSSGVLTETTELTRDDANLNNFIMGGNIGTGVQAYISKNIGLMLMPQFTYFFTPLRKNVPEKERLYSIGVNGGIILAF